MAIIDCDPWIVRRKMGGIAGASWRGVPTLRMRATSINSRRSRQLRVRTDWARLSKMWADWLTAGDRSDWDFMASIAGWRDEIEWVRELHGFEWFMALNSRLLQAGLPLLRDGGDWWWGQDLNTMSFVFNSATEISVTFAGNMDANNHLAVWARGPASVGVDMAAPSWVDWVNTMPKHWYRVGTSARAAVSPQVFALPSPVPIGRKLGVLAGGMDYTGMYCRQWLSAEVVRA